MSTTSGSRQTARVLPAIPRSASGARRSWRTGSRAWVIVAVYAVIATLWIYFSDHGLSAPVPAGGT